MLWIFDNLNVAFASKYIPPQFKRKLLYHHWQIIMLYKLLNTLLWTPEGLLCNQFPTLHFGHMAIVLWLIVADFLPLIVAHCYDGLAWMHGMATLFTSKITFWIRTAGFRWGQRGGMSEQNWWFQKALNFPHSLIASKNKILHIFVFLKMIKKRLTQSLWQKKKWSCL